MAITKVRFLRVSWGCEPAQLTVVARKGAPPSAYRAETPLRPLRGGVLLLDTQLPPERPSSAKGGYSAPMPACVSTRPRHRRWKRPRPDTSRVVGGWDRGHRGEIYD